MYSYVSPLAAGEPDRGHVQVHVPSPARAEPRIDIVCAGCGGNSVTRDAWAEWDADAQDWVLGSVFDQGFCHDCEEETRLEEVLLDAA
jgi:hypothetical protein